MPITRPPLAHWVLLLAVIAGVFGMHVLAAGDGPGHGMLPAVTMAGHHDDPAVAEPEPESAPVERMASRGAADAAGRAIDMAEVEIAPGRSPQTLALAAAIKAGQSAEIAQMQQLLSTL